LKPIYFYILFAVLIPFQVCSQEGKGKSTIESNHKKPIEAIRKIFEEFISYEDGLDSDENKNTLTDAVKSLPEALTENDLSLLVDVWMYYDPTDFPTRDLILPIFVSHKTQSIRAISIRLRHKKEWESVGTAPYADLKFLETDLKRR
jgi:hypothetical protein